MVKNQIRWVTWSHTQEGHGACCMHIHKADVFLVVQGLFSASQSYLVWGCEIIDFIVINAQGLNEQVVVMYE